MQTYLIWLTRLLFLLAVISGAIALNAYLSLQPSAQESGDVAILYTAVVGAVGFGISAAAAHFIGRGFDEE